MSIGCRRRGPFSSSLVAIGWLTVVGAAFPSGARAAARLVPQQYATIQDAIDHAVNGDTVLISAGTYRGAGNRDIQLRGRSVVVTSREGAEQTVIDCENLGRGFWVHQWESSAARIEKLTITNGNANGGDGGGIFCDIAGPIIADCRIIGNGGARYGGGLSLHVYGGRVERCVIAGNHAVQSGGGVGTLFGGVRIEDCLITGNRTDRGGGGGISFQDDDGDVVVGCTVAANYARDGGGGIYTNERSVFSRCILWGNCSSGPGRDLNTFLAGAALICCDVDTSGVYTDGTISYDDDCIFTDPMFCDPVPCSLTTGGDWTLSTGSPCLAEHSPCHELIGARDEGCGAGLPTGACCLLDGSCVVLDRGHCEEQQGRYLGDNTTCQPNPCQPVPVRETTWGRIKARFR